MVLMIDTAKYTIIAFNISDGLNKGKKTYKGIVIKGSL